MAAEVGTKIVWKGEHGEVKYKGPVDTSPGMWVGLELEKAKEGRGNGKRNGQTYFDGKEKHCIFVRPPTVCAATNDGFKSAFSQMQVFESIAEGELLQQTQASASTANSIRAGEGASAPPQKRASQAIIESLSPTAAKPVDAAPAAEALAKGCPDLDLSKNGELPEGYPEKLVQFYKSNGNGVPPQIPAQHMLYILKHSIKYYHQKLPSALNHIKVPEIGNLVVCGDTHGQLEDLLWIFFKHGQPGSDRIYLMNGDIADRGDLALEIYLILMAFNLRHPGCVWINKGNHEDNLLNLRYGFDQEIKDKYPSVHRQVYNEFQVLFKAFPMATVIDDRVFVVHGGLTRKPVRLGLIDGLDHRREIPDAPKGFQDLVFYDSVWSDPQDQKGVTPNPRGGDTIQFGPDVTAKFLAMNKLSLVIRSHQVPENLDADGYPRGFSWHHPIDGKVTPLCAQQTGMCLTVFSASNYCGNNANMGAVVMFNNSVQNMEIMEHIAQDIEYLVEVEQETKDATDQIRNVVASKEKSSHQRMMAASAGILKSALMDEIKTLIVRKKTELFEWFWAVDPEKDLHVSPEIWQEGCATVLNDALDWEEIQGMLALVDGQSGMINYSHFLSRFHVKFNNKLGLHSGFQRVITERCYEMLLVSDLSMRETFAVLDRNDDGLICLREFQEVLADLGTGMNKPQIQALMKTIIQHGCHPGSGGKLKIEDFLARVQAKYSSTNKKVAEGEQVWIPEFLGKVMKDAIHSVQRSGVRPEQMVMPSATPMGYLTQFFHMTDADQSGFLENDEFKKALQKLPCCKDMGDDKLSAIVGYCDADGNGRLNYLEFLHMLHMEDNSNSSLGEDILDHVNRTIYFDFRVPMRRAFQSFNSEDGRITAAQFEKLLSTVNEQKSPPPISGEQIKALIETLSVSDDGKVDLHDFLDSFEIIDEVFDEVLV
eukprot:TRINITY_DN364_c0_g1_i3.p1 TRINITY_DN364_c0_g1~~TRINITY_DN364_c0_g1_i3.p1  ORF type:complete len:954 (+),score=370.79 TRINITY_DN364_c0_g1_i3:57-2864(+)